VSFLSVFFWHFLLLTKLRCETISYVQLQQQLSSAIKRRIIEEKPEAYVQLKTGIPTRYCCLWQCSHAPQ